MGIKLLPNGDLDLESSEGYFLVTGEGYRSKSIPNTVTGNNAKFQLATPASGNKLVIKGMVISGNANTGTAKIRRSSNDENILPVYFSNFTRAATTGSLNFELEVDETIYVEIQGVGATDEIFVGISVTELVVQ